MNQIKINRIIAREGLIIIVIALVLYLFKTYVPSLPFPYPQCKLVFQDGSSTIIDIYPDIRAQELAGKISPNEIVKKYHYPGPELISKRTEKFIRDNKKSSPLVETKRVNEKQLYWYRAYFNFLFQPLPVRTLSIYIFLLLLRFIAWALRTLRGK